MEKKHLFAIFFLVVITSLMYAGGGQQAQSTTDAASRMKSIISFVCTVVVGLLGAAAVALFALSGVIYAVGQFFGAEMRGRATSWAMAAVVGAIIAVIIYIVGPTIVDTLWGESVGFSC